MLSNMSVDSLLSCLQNDCNSSKTVPIPLQQILLGEKTSVLNGQPTSIPGPKTSQPTLQLIPPCSSLPYSIHLHTSMSCSSRSVQPPAVMLWRPKMWTFSCWQLSRGPDRFATGVRVFSGFEGQPKLESFKRKILLFWKTCFQMLAARMARNPPPKRNIMLKQVEMVEFPSQQPNSPEFCKD